MPSPTERRIPMKLTDTQLMLLSAASQREDHGIELGPNLKGGAAQKLVRKLLTESLIEEVRTVGSFPVWRRDDDNQSLALRITKRGLAAIQVDEGGAHPEADEHWPESLNDQSGRCGVIRRGSLADREAFGHEVILHVDHHQCGAPRIDRIVAHELALA